MKKNIFKWLSIFVMAAMCVGFSSCGDDEEEVVPNAKEATSGTDDGSSSGEPSSGEPSSGEPSSGEPSSGGEGGSGALLTCPDNRHPHAIDLGLPSGTKWACCNVGASKPEDYGGHYAWGETSEKSVYNTGNYVHYNSSAGYVNIGSDIAGTSFDVAHVRMGTPWRMPSYEQQTEQKLNSSYQWTTQNGINGFLVTGPSGGQIFLPAAGERWLDQLLSAGSSGYYWSSSLDPDFGREAYFMEFWAKNHWKWYVHRAEGYSVRAVCP